jgi:hypothetical protein
MEIIIKGEKIMYPRVSIFNCVSTAYEMLRFSSDAIIQNSGYDNYDYIVVTWGPTPEVMSYLNDLKDKYNFMHIVSYETNKNIPYVPNLRGMMNRGFDYGFELNNYCGLVNTDMYFGKNWLLNLVKYANENDIVNSTHITPIQGLHVITANLGIPEYDKFNVDGFNHIYNKIFKDVLETEEQRGGWLATNTMPYLIPKKFWEVAGPWELMLGANSSPDRKFFQRCKDSGAHFTMSRSSIVYHHEAVERRSGKRPAEAKGMREE